MKKLLLQAALTLSALILAAACKKDDTADLPDLRTDFCDLTFVNGKLTVATFDDARVIDFSNQGVTASVKDTTMRYVLTYSVDANPKIYSNAPVMVCEAEPIDSCLTQRNDPVSVASAWIAGKYLNLYLAQMTSRIEPHPYAVSADTLIGRTFHMTLRHTQPKNDPASYTERIYASIPLASQHYSRADYDSISLHVNTFNGEQAIGFRLK